MSDLLTYATESVRYITKITDLKSMPTPIPTLSSYGQSKARTFLIDKAHFAETMAHFHKNIANALTSAFTFSKSNCLHFYLKSSKCFNSHAWNPGIGPVKVNWDYAYEINFYFCLIEADACTVFFLQAIAALFLCIRANVVCFPRILSILFL